LLSDANALIDGICAVTLTALSGLPARCALGVLRCARRVIARLCSGFPVHHGRAELLAISAPLDILTIGWGAL
jgi:hypothetical protein